MYLLVGCSRGFVRPWFLLFFVGVPHDVCVFSCCFSAVKHHQVCSGPAYSFMLIPNTGPTSVVSNKYYWTGFNMSQQKVRKFAVHFFYWYGGYHIIAHPLHLVDAPGTFTQHDLEHAEMANLKDEALQKDVVKLDSLILWVVNIGKLGGGQPWQMIVKPQM